MNIPSHLFEQDNKFDIYHSLVEVLYPKESFILEDLDEVLQNFVLFVDMDAEILNGGITQFIDNSTGDYFHETITAAENMGIPDLVNFLNDVANMFPNSQVPDDWTDRRELMDSLNEENTEFIKFADLDDASQEEFILNHDDEIPLEQISIEVENEWSTTWDNFDNWYFDHYMEIYEVVIEYMKKHSIIVHDYNEPDDYGQEY